MSELRKRVKSALIAKYLVNRQPALIRDRIRRDGSLERYFDLHSHRIIGLAQEASFRGDDILGATRRLLAGGENEGLSSLEGRDSVLTKREKRILLEVKREGGGIVRTFFDELYILSPDKEERMRARDRLMEEFGPTAPEFSFLCTVEERVPSDQEVGELWSELWDGVEGCQARIKYKLEDGEATIEDFVLDSLVYFERFCGPAPGPLAPEDYLGSVLPSYRKGLLRKNFRKGLEICLLGSLRDDLCPGAWLNEVGDDEMWEALLACHPELDPFSSLAALDIAVYRQHDERFRELAERAIGALCGDEFNCPSGVDLYQLITLLGKFVLNRLNVSEGGAVLQPYWKRMCSWMQALFVARSVASLSFDLDALKAVVESNLNPVGEYANVLDLQREPMFYAGEFSPSALRRHIIGRLLYLQMRHQAEGRVVPQEGDIKEARERLEQVGPFLGVALPGPLEGHRRPTELGRILPEDLKEVVAKTSGEVLVANLTNLSQHFHLDEDLRHLLRETISSAGREVGSSLDQDKLLAWLLNAGLAAAAERDELLAEAIASSVLAVLPGIKEEVLVAEMLQIVLIAGAANEEESVWVEWLSRQLAEVANRMPDGKLSTVLFHNLQRLRAVTRLELRICSQAEAIASAAAL